MKECALNILILLLDIQLDFSFVPSNINLRASSQTGFKIANITMWNIWMLSSENLRQCIL